MLTLLDHAAPSDTALAADGSARSLASRIGHAHLPPSAALRASAEKLAAQAAEPAGRVHSAGRFRDDAVHEALASVLGETLGQKLRVDFEWYVCRGAHFHNDAHYGDVVFGIWCMAGSAQLVMPRSTCRLGAAPGDIAVFDPFEIHGVLANGASVFEAELYAERGASVFVGFELVLDADVRDTFGVTVAAGGRVLSSATRISPRDGTIG